MRKILPLVLTLSLIGLVHGQAQPQDEARAIISKAIKAMGLDKLPKDVKGIRSKSKGTLEVMGATLNTSQEVTIRFPDQFREAAEIDVNGMKIPVVTVFDGKQGWVEVMGKVMKLENEILTELKNASSLIRISLLTPLLDKKYELSLLGEAKVEGKTAVGVRVVGKGFKDISFYFDKTTFLLTKVERQALDPATNMEVPEERIIKSYQDKDGRKIAKEFVILRDGKKFLEAELTDYAFLEQVDPGLFARPKE